MGLTHRIQEQPIGDRCDLGVKRRLEGWAQTLKEDNYGGQGIHWLEPTGSKMENELTSSKYWDSIYIHCKHLSAKWHTHGCHSSSEANCERSKWMVVQFLEIPALEIVRLILPFISSISEPPAFWNGPHSVCELCFSQDHSCSFEKDHILSMECVFSLSKPMYLSLCLSPNSFCGETKTTTTTRKKTKTELH